MNMGWLGRGLCCSGGAGPEEDRVYPEGPCRGEPRGHQQDAAVLPGVWPMARCRKLSCVTCGFPDEGFCHAGNCYV